MSVVVAVPSPVVHATVKPFWTAPFTDTRNPNVFVPVSPSVSVTSPIEICALSSSVIVPVPVSLVSVLRIPTPVARLRFAPNCSLNSTRESLLIATVTV